MPSLSQRSTAAAPPARHPVLHASTALTPLWPCGMTGAVACLAGIPDLAVVIHGSSGCFFYPQSLLPVPLFSTFIHEREVIFGSLDRFADVLGSIPFLPPGCCGRRPAYLPSSARRSGKSYAGRDPPGFAGLPRGDGGGIREGPRGPGTGIDPEEKGVNIAGLNLLDPFTQGTSWRPGDSSPSPGPRPGPGSPRIPSTGSAAAGP